MSEAIENKIAKSGLITLDLEELKPQWEIVGFDMAEVLWEGIALKEKDYRVFIDSNDWSRFDGKSVYIYCSEDAIIPTWAYMLLAKALDRHANMAIVGSKTQLEAELWRTVIRSLDLSMYDDQRVILKGCSNEAIPESIYLELTSALLPRVKSLMFGEPCSTVPVYKKK